jgi:hypothetical protein
MSLAERAPVVALLCALNCAAALAAAPAPTTAPPPPTPTIVAGSAPPAIPLQIGNLKTIRLPAPQLDKPGTVMQALSKRESLRNVDTARDMSLADISNILWAVDGVNRAAADRRTAPTGFARLARQASVVFVVLRDGAYKHEPETHSLIPVLAGDQRKNLGDQDFVVGSPLNLIFGLDLNIVDAPGSRRSFEERYGWGNVEIGHKSMAGYLYCAVTVAQRSIAPAAPTTPSPRGCSRYIPICALWVARPTATRKTKF